MREWDFWDATNYERANRPLFDDKKSNPHPNTILTFVVYPLTRVFQEILFFDKEETMSCGDSDGLMVSNDCSIDAFLKAIEEKDLFEIISFADKEATAAWRLSYRENKFGDAQNDLPNRYEQTLEELISFLRAALPYRPHKMHKSLFEQFVQLQRKVNEGKSGPNRSYPSNPLNSDTASGNR